MTSGNSKDVPARPWQNLLLLLVFTGGSLWVADLVFRSYERNQLLPRMPEISSTAPVNLSALRYNDGIVERESAPGDYRILSFGDSFTYSVMNPQLSYNGVIQQQLQAVVHDKNFRVINLGEPATGTRHFREAHDFWSKVFEHDAVLFHIFLGNDILDDAYIHASVVWAPNEAVIRGDNPILEAGNRRVPRKFPLRMMDYAYAWWMSSRTRLDEDLPEGYNWAALTSFDEATFASINFKYMENFDPEKMTALLAGYEQVALLLKRAQEISESGTKVMVVLGPSEPQVDDALRDAALAAGQGDASQYDLALAQRIIASLQVHLAPDVNLLDLTWSFRKTREETGEKLFFRRNTHWDKAGNQLAGEIIAGQIAVEWLDEMDAREPLPEWVYTERVSDAEIESYIAPLVRGGGTNLPVITGAVRSVQMIDGIIGRVDNWAIAPLNQPVLVEFPLARQLSALRIHLYAEDGRKYRFTVEALQGKVWRMLADQSETAVGGIRDIPIGQGPVTAIRITGLHNSAQKSNSANAFLHIEELELVE